MAVRVRTDGTIWCAAMCPPEPGDVYIDDGLHYQLSVELKLLVTELGEEHSETGQWWWKGHVPEGVVIDPFYVEARQGGRGRR